MEKTKPEIYEKLRRCTVKIEAEKIPAFIPLINEGAELKKASYHSIIHTHPFTGKELLYLGKTSQEIIEEDAPISLQELIDFGEGTGVYAHEYSEGDLLIWDNI